MSKADAYINQGLNETIVKFEIDGGNASQDNLETIIILDISTPNPPHYSEIRPVIFKDILPNLNIEIKQGIHFIYNESEGIRYFKGNLSDFNKINISNTCPPSLAFYEIETKLKNILDNIDKECYINLLGIISSQELYSDKEITKITENSLFYEYKEKFKNFFSQILFINCFNKIYLTFTRFCKGFARKFINVIPSYCSTFSDINKNKYSINQIGELINNKDIKAIPHLDEYLEAIRDGEKEKELIDLHNGWWTDFISIFKKIRDDYLANSEKNINLYLDKIEKKYNIKNEINLIAKMLDNKKKYEDIIKLQNKIDEETNKKLQEYEKLEEEYFESNMYFPNELICLNFPFNNIVKGFTYYIIHHFVEEKVRVNEGIINKRFFLNINGVDNLKKKIKKNIEADMIIDIFNKLEFEIKKLIENKDDRLIISPKFEGSFVSGYFGYINRYELTRTYSSNITFPFIDRYFFRLYVFDFDKLKNEFISKYKNNYFCEEIEEFFTKIYEFKFKANILKDDLNKIKLKHGYGCYNNIQKLFIIIYIMDYIMIYSDNLKVDIEPVDIEPIDMDIIENFLSDFHINKDIIMNIYNKFYDIKIIVPKEKQPRLKRKRSFETDNNIIDEIRNNKDISTKLEENQLKVRQAINKIGIREFDKYLDNMEKKFQRNNSFKEKHKSIKFEKNNNINDDIEKFFEKLNELNQTNISIDDILKFLNENSFTQKEINESKNIYIKMKKDFYTKLRNAAQNFEKSFDNTPSDFKKLYLEKMKEKEKFEKGLINGDENSIEILKKKIYQKDSFILFHDYDENHNHMVTSDVVEFKDYSDLVIDLRLYTDHDDCVTRYLRNESYFDEKISGFKERRIYGGFSYSDYLLDKYFRILHNNFLNHKDRKHEHDYRLYDYYLNHSYYDLRKSKCHSFNNCFYRTLDYLIYDKDILDKVKKYLKYYKGELFLSTRIPRHNLHLIEVGKECSSIIKEKIELFFKDLKKIMPSGWKIISKNNFFRIEPFGDKLTEIELPCGKSTIYVDGIFKKIEDAMQVKSSNGEQQIKINNKGKVTQNNIKEVYEDCFKMIINRVISNKVIEEKEKNINNELIKYINRLENQTEGWANKNSKSISNFLSELNQNNNISSLNQSNLDSLTKLGLDKFKDEIDSLVKKELVNKNEKINPEFILLLDTSENMEDYAENFVRNIFYEVLLKLNFDMKQEVKIYTFNSIDTDKSILTLKKVKKFGCDCEGEINFTQAFEQALEEIIETKNTNYYLLIVLSGNIKDKELIRSIAFKSIGLSSKVFIKSRVVKYITDKSKFDEDEITYGLLQQISTGDLKVYQPIEINPNESQDTQIAKLLNSFQ